MSAQFYKRCDGLQRTSPCAEPCSRCCGTGYEPNEQLAEAQRQGDEPSASLAQRARHVEVLRAIGSAFVGIPSPCEEREAVDAAIAALYAQPRGVDWRCFYCDEVFTDAEAAALHFGTGGVARHDEPACRIDIAKYREMESLLSRYQDEDADVHRAMHRMAGEHQLALRRAEEDGYAKGLKDSGKCPCAAPQPPEVRGVPEPMKHWPIYGDEPIGPQEKRADYVNGWNACRQAMLAAPLKDAAASKEQS